MLAPPSHPCRTMRTTASIWMHTPPPQYINQCICTGGLARVAPCSPSLVGSRVAATSLSLFVASSLSLLVYGAGASLFFLAGSGAIACSSSLRHLAVHLLRSDGPVSLCCGATSTASTTVSTSSAYFFSGAACFSCASATCTEFITFGGTKGIGCVPTRIVLLLARLKALGVCPGGMYYF